MLCNTRCASRSRQSRVLFACQLSSLSHNVAPCSCCITVSGQKLPSAKAAYRCLSVLEPVSAFGRVGGSPWNLGSTS
eukprot:128055-Chlamydomonas_euryale.AAC.1